MCVGFDEPDGMLQRMGSIKTVNDTIMTVREVYEMYENVEVERVSE